MTQPGIEPRFPIPLANTLTIMPMGGTVIQILIIMETAMKYKLKSFTPSLTEASISSWTAATTYSMFVC